MAELADDEKLLAIEVPEGGKPGDKLNVKAPDGRIYEIIIPSGVGAGDRVNVIVKVPPQEEGLPIANPVDGVNANGDQHHEPISDQPPVRPPRAKTDSKSVAASAGAAGAGAVAGALVLGVITGPVTAAVLVGGGVMYATTQDNSVGEGARQVGAKTADAAGYAYDKAVEYKVVDKTKAAASATYSKAKEINEEYDLTGKTKRAAAATYSKAKEINEEHKLTEKVSSAASSVASKAKEVNAEYDISGKASAAAATTAMAAVSLFGKAKEAMNSARRDSEASRPSQS
jgi:hypothetical protein